MFSGRRLCLVSDLHSATHSPACATLGADIVKLNVPKFRDPRNEDSPAPYRRLYQAWKGLDDNQAYALAVEKVIVAERGGIPVGYMRLEYFWSIVPYIALIWVLPEHRRQGAGKATLRYVEDHLRDRGHHQLFSSSQVNEAAPQAWHRHVGFEECGIIAGINDGGVGEVFFRKRLR